MALLSVSVSACAGKGDFGRKAYSVLDDEIIPAASKVTGQIRKKTVSWYPLTHDERQMRNISWSLITPYGKPVFLEKTIGRIEDAGLVSNTIAWNSPERYLARIKREKFSNGNARVGFIRKHIRDDQWQFDRFKPLVRRVFQADAKRLAALERMRDKGPSEYDNALGRVKENRRVVSKTLHALDLRLRGYDKALRQTQLQFPEADINRAGAMLVELKSQRDRFAARHRRDLGAI